MTETPPYPGTPRKVLLATDLSARCDRALERAVGIAQRDDAQLIILHVFEAPGEPPAAHGNGPESPAPRPPDMPALVKQRIQRGLRSDSADFVGKATVLMEEGNPAEVIEQIAMSEHVDLIVTGIARERPFTSRPVILGETVEKLLRRLPAPILIVRNRPLAAYQRIVVATDLSEPSAHALQLALRFFPVQTLHLLLATDMQGEANDQGERIAELDGFLSSFFLPDGDRERLVPVIEPGAPPQVVREFVQRHGADLVVLGTRGRGAMLEALLGSTAKSILAMLPCDALVVRRPAQ